MGRSVNRTLRRLGWTVSSITATLVLTATVLAFVTGWGVYEGLGFRSFGVFAGIAFGTVALVIIVNQPRHAIGWVLAYLGLGWAVRDVLLELALYAQLVTEQLTLATTLAWIVNWYWQLIVYGIFLLLLLFPTGKLPTSRWRVALGLLGVTVALSMLHLALQPGPLAVIPGLANPYGVEFTGSLAVLRPYVLAVLLSLGFGTAAAAAIVRFRRAGGIERQQLKWFAYAVTVALVLVGSSSWPGMEWLLAISWVAVLLPPVAIGLAVMRYRLYDIDLIIRRTLVYGLVTALLAAVYFSSVVLLQRLFTALAGQQSPVAIVISTLVIAALFSPVRGRVQRFINRRFYRQEYDAVQTLAQFGAVARQEVDLETLTGSLLQVVDQTMQPDELTLWLAPLTAERDEVDA
ncbi:MAG: hypothetical protein R3300_18075 [Candidatus Promineifilaceae bacterium]|nr:hypothetical protein [Candidatus Promineifilaceae bacterium]